MTSPVLFSSKSDVWATSPDFFAKMARRYGPFDLDVCTFPKMPSAHGFSRPSKMAYNNAGRAVAGAILHTGKPSASGSARLGNRA